MTIATTSNKVIGQGNGATTNWPFSFLIPDQASLIVLYTDANGAITILTTAQYSVTGLGDSSGGAVTYPLSGSPIAVGTTLTVIRDVAYVQQSSIKNQGGFFPDVYESALDYLTMQTQQLSEALGRAVVVPITTDDINTELPTPIAGAALGWSADGSGLVNIVTLGGVGLPLAIAQGGTGQQTKATAAAALGVVELTGAGGTANVQTANAPQNYAALAANDLFIYTPGITNTGATTLNVAPAGGGALGAKNVFAGGAALVGGELTNAIPVLLEYDGVRFNIVNFYLTLKNKTLVNPANTVQALVDGANVAWDTSFGAYATLTLGGNRTLSAPTNLKAGGHYVLLLTSGGFTPTWNAVFVGVNGGGIPAPAASGMTAYVFESDGANLYLTSMPILSTFSNALGADVALNNTGTYFDGPSVNAGTKGVFLVVATLTLVDTGAVGAFDCKLWDGTTVFASTTSRETGAGNNVTTSLAGIITNPAGNLRASVKDTVATTGKILFNATGNSKDSTIYAVRIG